jgi:hypothetical protein
MKYINTPDSDESLDWAKYLLKEGGKLYDADLPDLKCDKSMALSADDIKNGHHLIIANWYYNMCHKNALARKDVSLRNLTRFESEHRERILNKLTRCSGAFNMNEDEKEALCAYFFIRRFDKFKNMFIANKLLALQVLNRYASEKHIRFEDAEALMREYSYLPPHKI